MKMFGMSDNNRSESQGGGREALSTKATLQRRASFDRVSHDRLMHLVGQKVRDKRRLRLIGDYLRAPQQTPDGRQEKRIQGTPQGGPLSPLLANICLDALDKELEHRGLSFVRYADDIAIFVSSPRSAERVRQSVTAWIEKHLKVEVNRAKSRSGPSDQSALLGFRLYAAGRIGVAPKAVERMKAKVRELWDARQSLTSEQLRDHWRRYIRGWWNYFELADWRREVEDLTGWIRRHMRKCFWLRWHCASDPKDKDACDAQNRICARSDRRILNSIDAGRSAATLGAARSPRRAFCFCLTPRMEDNAFPISR